MFFSVEGLPFGNMDRSTVEESVKIGKFYYKNDYSTVITFRAFRALLVVCKSLLKLLQSTSNQI